MVSDLQVDKESPVLVTGASGYVAGVIIKQLLDLGVTVHATVRDPSKKERLQYLIKCANDSTGSIKFYRGDLLERGSFAEAMAGCSIVFHTASPFSMNVKDPESELITPAVEGTRNVLNQATETSSVKRVVLTSSVVATASDPIDNERVTEDTWNRTATLQYQPYYLSKTLAEQAAWVVAGSQNQWTMTTINPGFVLGPGMRYHESSQSFTFMRQYGDGTFASGAPNLCFGVVDVRDVARAHIAAAYKPGVKGRHLVVGHNTGVTEMSDCLKEKYSKDYPLPPRRLPKILMWLIGPYIGLTRRYVRGNADVQWNYDNTKSKEELGIEYTALKTTVEDMFQQLIDEEAITKK